MATPRFKIKCIATDNSVNCADFVVKGEKGWKVCGKPVENPYVFDSFTEADKVRLKLATVYKGKICFLLEACL